MKKRLVSALLALSMLCSALPAPAFAQGADSAGLEQEQCSCSIRCTADGMNPDCPVCAADAAACGAGLDPATVETADPEPTPEATATPVPTEAPAPAGEPAPQTLGLVPSLLAANDGASTLAQEGTKPVGEGTQEDPYQISTADDLFWFAALVNGTLEGVEQNAAACAVLTTNITISEGRAWTPIGNSIDNQYTGTFDGDGHTINNLKIDNGSAQYQGFVGCLGAGGKLQNLTMGASCSVTGYSPVGGLCSSNQGTIENCTNSGTVSGFGTVGGVCGLNGGTLTGCTNSGAVTGSGQHVGGVCGINQSTITGCTNSGEVTGSDQNVGGVCGENMGGTIQNCTNKAEVTGSSKVGGVCSENYGPITGCTNSGTVSGLGTVGGVCGQNSSNITYCYSTGTVTSTGNNVGGVCGFNGNAGALTNCYWLDTAYSGNGVGTNNNGTVNNVCSKTDTAFSSGAVCWLLNGESADSPVWYQKLGTDTYPVLDSSHGTVYCIDKGLSFYSNDSNAKLDISDAIVALSQERFTYNGTVQKPTVTVTLGGKTLTENTHYTVAYSGNCIDAGDYAVTVTGTDVYSGTVSKKHTIYPAEISIASATVQDKTYDGGTDATVDTVTFDGLVNGEGLTINTDYTVTATFADKNVGDSKQATVTVELKNGNYTFVQGGNTTTATARIAPLAVALTWSETTNFTYDGQPHSVTTEVTNKVDGDTLNLTYAGNTEKNVGNYTATVTALDGADAANYTIDGVENLTQAWSIASASLAGAEVTLDESTFTYTGSEQKPTVTVKQGGKTLNADTDYDVDFGGESINAGTYTVTVTGKGNYSGTATEKPTYTINPAALTISDATLAAKTYDGTTAATVIDVTFTGLQNGETLTLGSGYTATAVFDDANAGTDKTATVTVTLKNGNYKLASDTYQLTGQTIRKANWTGVTTAAGYVTSGQTESVKLPATPDGASYNNVATSNGVRDVAIQDGVLRYTGLDTVQQGTNYTVTVNVAGGNNYNDYTVTVTLQGCELMAADTQVKLELETVQAVPGTAFNTQQKVESELARILVEQGSGFTAGNAAFYDVSLEYSQDGGQTWIKATAGNFPAEGITVTLPYPNGTGKDTHNFRVVHMFAVTSERLGTTAGDTETPAVTKTDAGIQVTLNGLSPVAIGWSEIETGTSSSATSTPAPTAAPAPDATVYYTCPACGHHDWTATDEGYRCDTCGYVESLKQLTGYGNVKGVYEPKTGSNTAGGHAVTVPQTGDTSNPALWLGLLLLSGLALGGITLYRRKKTQ